MKAKDVLRARQRGGAVLVWLICLAVLLGSAAVASRVQRDFGRVEVRNVSYPNFNGVRVRAKLFRPSAASAENPLPGVVYIHGYQNNRETGDGYCIELARRGAVVLTIDAIGRGNSGEPGDPSAPDFDPTYGGRKSLEYLRGLDFVDVGAVGLMGHSLGANMAYDVALTDPGVRALIITGAAYDLRADTSTPKNMLMIIGKWDEFRQRMTGTRDIEREWMSTPQTRRAFPVPNPEIGVTYGDFASGTARRVVVPRTIHFMESHNQAAIAESVDWMRQALGLPDPLWAVPADQIWPIKEWATLSAMLAGLWSLMPLGLILLRTRWFHPLLAGVKGRYACPPRVYATYAAVNGGLMWLYLPLIFVLFGFHVYVVHIDKVFPMMMVNGIVWWFFWINVIGFLFFRRWHRKQAGAGGPTLAELGLSFWDDRFGLDWGRLGRTGMLAAILFGYAYAAELVLERLFIVDYRFLFPFASDLTPFRVWTLILYLPFLTAGFLLMGVFLHGQMRRPPQAGFLRTYAAWTAANILVMVAPLILFLGVQYGPLFVNGFIPLVGPGGMFVSFILNIFHIIGVLIVVLPISTWFFQLTGKIYLGAFVNALLLAWMFASSQVIAPIPV